MKLVFWTSVYIEVSLLLQKGSLNAITEAYIYSFQMFYKYEKHQTQGRLAFHSFSSFAAQKKYSCPWEHWSSEHGDIDVMNFLTQANVLK